MWAKLQCTKISIFPSFRYLEGKYAGSQNQVLNAHRLAGCSWEKRWRIWCENHWGFRSYPKVQRTKRLSLACLSDMAILVCFAPTLHTWSNFSCISHWNSPGFRVGGWGTWSGCVYWEHLAWPYGELLTQTRWFGFKLSSRYSSTIRIALLNAAMSSSSDSSLPHSLLVCQWGPCNVNK